MNQSGPNAGEVLAKNFMAVLYREQAAQNLPDWNKDWIIQMMNIWQPAGLPKISMQWMIKAVDAAWIQQNKTTG